MSEREDVSGWAVGFTVFAAIMMLMAGAWQALAGLVAIFENEFYVQTRNYLFQFDATTWGWIHLLVGVVVAFAGWGLLSGQTWARIVGITLAALSATVNFLFIPYYPVWSILIIAVDIFVIWALAAHGRQFKELKQSRPSTGCTGSVRAAARIRRQLVGRCGRPPDLDQLRPSDWIRSSRPWREDWSPIGPCRTVSTGSTVAVRPSKAAPASHSGGP